MYKLSDERGTSKDDNERNARDFGKQEGGKNVKMESLVRS